MTRLTATFDTDIPSPIGLIVLKADETLEPELRQFLPDLENPVHVTRIDSAPEVTRDALISMEANLARSAALLPDLDFAAVAYGCTSASALIGSDEVARQVRIGCRARHVTNPVSATLARAAHLGVSRFALVSPYIDEVNAPLIAAFADQGLDMSLAGSFGIANEQDVVRISTASIVDAALKLGSAAGIEAVFLSCTNLRTVQAIPEIEAKLGKPVVSSNSALTWHLRQIVPNGRDLL